MTDQIVNSIKGTPFDVDEDYFERIMQDLGLFLCKRYHETDCVSPLEVLSQIAYVQDLTIQQKMWFAFFIGRHEDYEGLILQCLEKL